MALLDPQERSRSAGLEPWSWRHDVFNGYAHTTSRANQYLATDWGSLTTIDLQAIKDSVAQRLASGSNLADAEAALLILGILTAGRSAADWLASHVVAELSGEEQEVVLRVDGSDWRWQLPLGRHVRDKQPSSEFLIQPQSHVDLACVPLVKSALQSCLQARFNTITPPPTPFPLFSTWSFIPSERERDEQLVRGRAASIIRERPGARSSTLTLQSLERWFWAAAAQTEAGDPTSACRITDRKENPYRAQLHYGVMSRAAASKLQRRTLARAGLDGREADLASLDGHIGSRRTPPPELISQFAAHSSGSVSNARRARDRRRLHNALTFHTAAIIMLSTGLRPARSAHVQFRPDSGIALVFDKVVGDERVRPVPIGQLCREQVAHYLAHLSLMEFPQSETGHRLGASAELPFTIIGRGGTSRRTTLAACWRFALRSFSTCLPLNLQRHLLRTALVGSASAESIDAFLGHWVVGTEPWGRFSGLDPIVYAQDIGAVLDDALGSAGWRVEHGLPAKMSDLRNVVRLGPPPKAPEPVRMRGLLAQSSPFNAALKQRQLEEMIPCLPDWFVTPPAEPDAALGQILASAIVNGAFLDPAWFGPFLRAVRIMPLRRSRLCVEMEPADPEDTRHVYAYPRRWFCDPVTDLLIRRWRGLQGSSLDEKVPIAEACFSAFLTNRGHELEGGGLARIVHEATLRWRLAMPGLLVSYAAGEGPSLSLPSTTWDRVESGRRIAADMPVTQPGSRAMVQRGHYPELYGLLIAALKSSNPAEGAASLTSRLSSGDDRLVSHILRWAALAIGPRGCASEGRREWGQKQPYSPSRTIAGYAEKIADLLAGELEANLGDMDAAQLDQLYRTGFEKIEKPGPRNKALNAVLSFQGYLCSLSPELDVGDSYDEYREEGRVSINVISSRDYERALEQLPGGGRDERLRRLVLMLAFRTGLRLNEILGLRHEDLASGADPLSGTLLVELYVRPYSAHFLKTQQSRRMIPLDVLLTPDELQDLISWRDEHAAEAGGRPLGLLFTHAGGGSGRPVASSLKKQLIHALFRATGDEGIRFEHLRHSFATQLLACLLLPREGSYLLSPKGFDLNSISDDRRDRVIARVSGSQRPGRSALHIVSQLCGHGPVTTTLRWYAHMLDWSVGAFVNRRALQPRISRHAALAIMMQTNKDYSGESLARADHRHRTKLAPTQETRGAWERYRTPEPTPDLRRTDEGVPLMAIHQSIQKRFDHLARDSFSKGARPLRRLRAPARQAPVDVLPGWRDIRDAITSARNGERSSLTARRLGVSGETIVRYRRIADIIAGPRRRGEGRMRFEPKMSAARRAKFNVDEWRRTFPQEPRGDDALDLVDHVWRVAGRAHTAKAVQNALREFCRHYSVDTGLTSFLKRKDAEEFYRGMAMLGFNDCLSVVHLDKRKRSPNCRAIQQNGKCDCGCDRLRWRLAGALPEMLRPKPRIVMADPQDRFPRAVAIHVGIPKVPSRRRNDPVKPNNHKRAAVRFVLTMLAIATLDNIKEPSRRRGWRPGYGGYF